MSRPAVQRRRAIAALVLALPAAASADALDRPDDIDIVGVGGSDSRLHLHVVLDERVTSRAAALKLRRKLAHYVDYVGSKRAYADEPKANPQLPPVYVVMVPRPVDDVEMQNLASIRNDFARAGIQLEIETFDPPLKRQPRRIGLRSVPILVLMLAGSIAGCAGDAPLGAAEPRWSQRPGESGLEVGSVVAVEAVAEPPPQLTRPGAAGPVSGGVQPDTEAILRAASRKGDAVYRHVIRLRSGATARVDADVAFGVGDCVALRSGPGGAQPVAAQPGACD